MNNRPSKRQFGEAYTDAMADAANRLRMLESLIARSGELLNDGDDSAIILLRDCYSLVGQVCRIVARTQSARFGVTPYRPVAPAWPRGKAPHLRWEACRQILPAHFEQLSTDEVHVKLLDRQRAADDDFRSMHDTAEILFDRLKERTPLNLQASMLEIASTMHQQLVHCLSEHVVTMPEWRGLGFSKSDQSVGAHWFFMEAELESVQS